jgi:hypothetical protein
MDLFKNFKDLKAYCTELKDLAGGICIEGTKIKIGKYKIVQTPSKDAATRLKTILKEAIEKEHKAMTDIYKKIETTLEEIQLDLFKEEPDTTKPDKKVQ